MLMTTLTRSEQIAALATVIRDNRPGMSRAASRAAAHRLSTLARLIRRGRRIEQHRPLTLAEEDRLSDFEQEALELAHSLGDDFDLHLITTSDRETKPVIELPDGRSNDRCGWGWLIP